MSFVSLSSFVFRLSSFVFRLSSFSLSCWGSFTPTPSSTFILFLSIVKRPYLFFVLLTYTRILFVLICLILLGVWVLFQQEFCLCLVFIVSTCCFLLFQQELWSCLCFLGLGTRCPFSCLAWSVLSLSLFSSVLQPMWASRSGYKVSASLPLWCMSFWLLKPPPPPRCSSRQPKWCY